MTTEQRIQAMHLLTYITDDGAIAAYVGIPRTDVALMRRESPQPQARRYAKERYECVKASSGTGERQMSALAAQDGSQRLYNAMATVIDRLAHRKNVTFNEACVMAQNCVGGY